MVVAVAKAFVGGQDRFAVHAVHDDFELGFEEERFGSLFGQRVESGFHRDDLVGVGFGEVVLFGGVLREVVQVHAGGQERAPDEFPMALAQCGAEGLDVIDELGARRGLPSTMVSQTSRPSSGLHLAVDAPARAASVG